jgi:hypothetical protein
MSTGQSIGDLALAVHRELKRRRAQSPRLSVLTALFQTMFSASLKTEESQAIEFHITYLNPENPDPSPPPNVRANRWQCIRLGARLPFELHELVKLAKATSPRTSSISVYHDRAGKIFVWGLVDQAIGFNDFINNESDTGPERPGVLQASIVGVGHLRVYREYEHLAELRHDVMLPKPLPALLSRPISAMLAPGLAQHRLGVAMSLREFRTSVGAGYDWSSAIDHCWTSAIARLVIRVQSLGHGGAFLISPRNDCKSMHIKYQLDYRRLKGSLVAYAAETVKQHRALEAAIKNKGADLEAEMLHRMLSSTLELEDIRRELDSILWFISLLTRLDGVVLLTPHLDVRGFGVKLDCPEKMMHVVAAGDKNATFRRCRKIDHTHFGTRHQSMMRYCFQVPGSIGIVISQDGDARFMAKKHNRLVVWENVKLRYDDFVPIQL